MTKYILIIISIIILSSTPAQAYNHKNPSKAVKNELNSIYKIEVPESKTVQCYKITNNRYNCIWEGVAVAVEGCYWPRGTATVIYYRNSIEVNIRFSGQYQYCSYPY
jgi:lipoprotein-anchoring transpeptidase ErfK/SrfK